MTHHPKETRPQPVEQDTSVSRPDSHSAQRRRLLRAGVSSSLLLTVASRPAWANGGMCTPSALASANASGGHDFEGCGIAADWWRDTDRSRWPVPSNTPFHLVFGLVTYNDNVLYSGMTIGDVIGLTGSEDPVNGGVFGFHLIGAYLNALAFPPDQGVPGYPLTAVQVISAFNSLNGAPDSSFQALKNTLEQANNQYDGITQKPDSFF